MQNYRFNFKKLLILFIAVLGFGQHAMAANDYYAKVTASLTPTGSGTVYVEGGTQGSTSEGGGHTGTKGGSVSVDINAEPSNGYEFYQWTFTSTNTGTFSDASSASTTVSVQASSSKRESNAKLYTIKAEFKALPQFYFSATGTATPTAGGTVTASVTDNQKYGEHHNSTSASTTATFGVSSINRGYVWVGWNESATGTATTAQSMTYTVTNNSAGSTQNITRYAIFQQLDDPTAVSANNITIATGETSTIVPMLTPTGCFSDLSFSSNATSVATVDAATGVVTGVSAGTATITITAKKIDPTQSVSTTITVTVKDKCATPTISFSNITADGATATLATTTTEATIYYTINGSDPTASSTAYTAPFAVEPGDEVRAIAIVTGTDAAYWLPSDILTRTYSSCKVATPSILVDGDGKISFTCPEEGTITYKYCISSDGSCTPTTTWDGTPIAKDLANNEKIIKVIATNADCLPSDPATKLYTASGTTTGGIVYLNDYEDHNWAYYKGREGVKVGTAADAPDYNDKYKYTLYSPDPRNVKITYRGYNTTANTIILGSNTVATSTLNDNTAPHVSNATGEGQNTFVYYKTLEKFVIGYFTDNADWNGIPDDPTKENYPYTVISNPFSVRPSTGSGNSKKYYGFAGWKIISGGKYIGRGNGGTYTAASDGDVLGLDELIHFVNLDADVTYTPNCTSAEIVLEATWAEATVWSGNAAHDFGTSGTYETNFIVANNNIASIEQGTPCTIIGMNPDGTGDNSGTRTITGLKVTTTSTTDPYDRSNCVKVEWIRHGNGTFDANGRNMTMGRGIISSSGSGNTAQGYVYGNNTQNQDVVNTVKVESGYYSDIANINNKAATATNAINSYVILGCDYDRALANYYVPANEIDNNTYNIKLRASRIYGPNGSPELNRKNGQLYMRSLFKSGVFASEIGNEYYFHTYTKPGQRYIEMEGGYNKGHIKGGSDGSTSQGSDVRAMSFRMKGGRVDGQVACGSTSTFCSGTRLVAITGGRIGGWIAPGSNCSSGGSSSTSTTGTTDGTSYVYFGGTAEINSRQFGTTPSMIFQSTGGVIYGAGLGYQTTDRTGEMTHGSNIVFADDAYCERGIYGGGAIGQALTTANIFILGGRVGTGTGQIKDQGTNTTYDNVKAGVYGGACNRGGENSFIYMDGGIVESGIYGGANINGTMTGNVTMKINGGQVGTDDASANIHGGGYGNGTRVQGSVDLTVGASGATEGVTVYGDVYGGSAEGKTNGSNSLTSGAETNVTLNAGTINGSLYGGGLGTESYAADVYGPVAVKVYGGSVKKTDENGANGSGAVYGANNINGAPQRSVTVDIYGTDPAPAAGGYALFSVYGGGNKAGYTYGNGYPTVTVHNCDNSIEYVYGGGNAAAVAATDVTIYGGNKIGNVFGGGNGISGTAANVNGNTNVKIYGGTIGDVYGGSNSKGTIGGTISVNVNAQAETDHTACPMAIDNVYGGGNKAASNAGTVTIGCTGTYVAASEGVTESGYIRNVYGGANQADITGNIGLDIKAGHIDNVFGGNNNSGSISGTITVTVKEDNSCDDDMLIGNVYGGGNLAAYGSTGSDYPVVKIEKGHLIGSVFGGGKGDATDANHATGAVTGNPQVTIGSTTSTDVVTIDGNVFGGGDAANVIGSPVVLVQNCNTKIGKTSITDGVTTYTNGSVYGGGNAAHVTGSSNSTSVTINGGTINRVFGGGNGEVSAANVEGNANTTIHAGTIHQAFAGSNAAGTISGTAKITVDKTGSCDEKIDELYGGGNLAEGNAGTVTVACGAIVDDVYGGANQAKVTSDITLNITGGTIKRVFGGNNTSGNITGSITVNIDKDTDCESFSVENVYGAGNQAKYEPTTPGSYPAVNIKNGTVTYDVFGGGLGSTAIVTSNPTVTINGGAVRGNVFGGGSEANTVGTTSVTVQTGSVDVDVYGGGALADVEGSTTVALTGGTVTGNAYGGGLGRLAAEGVEAVAATVTGNTTVTVSGGTTSNVFGCNNFNGGPQGTVNVTISGGTVTNNVYGGGNLAAATANPIVTINGGTMQDVFGGGLGVSAVITGNTTISINKTAETMSVANVFGGGSAANVAGNTNVSLSAGSVNNIYGGGKAASIVVGSEGTGKATVSVTGGSVVKVDSKGGSIYGGGLGNTTTVAGNVTVSVSGGDIASDVYGGSGFGTVNTDENNTTTVTITNGTIAGNVYGGGFGQVAGGDDPAYVADVKGNVAVSIQGGTMQNVFGCNNANGGPKHDVTVTVSGGTINDNIYGGGNLAAATANPIVTINGGTMQDVFGGGLGKSAVITGNTTISINKTAETMSVANVFGGGSAANVAGNTSITMTEGTVNNIYGGGEAANVVVGASETGKTVVNMNGGTVSHSIYGGGLGNTTNVATSTTVTANGGTVTEDVYGGSGFGTVGATTVTINNGATVTRDVFGGGFGQKANNEADPAVPAYEADVTGNASVTINKGAVIGGNVYGGNNTNGSPKGTITVLVNGPADATEKTATPLALTDVFGGGKNAATNSNGAPKVTIKGCETFIGRVFGGGDAASAPATDVEIWGGHITSAFAGGNGEITAAHIGYEADGSTAYTSGSGDVNITIKGGEIANVFGGSNNAGNIRGAVNITIDKDPASCDFKVTNLYGGGNLAPSKGGTLTIACTGDGKIDNVYGGANQANVEGDVTLLITGGNIGNAFAGNNQSGIINGALKVEVDWSESTCASNSLNNVYGGGNQAPYTTPEDKADPIIRLINGTINYNVYGGGLGNTATITGNTNVILEGATVNGSIYGGGDAAAVIGNSNVSLTKGSVANAFGGGNAAKINGNASISITNEDVIAGNIYGGGNLEGVTGTASIGMTNGTVTKGIYGGCNSEGTIVGDITLNITGGQIGTDASQTANVHGGGYGYNTKTSGNVNVNLNGTSAVVYGDIYGGSALGDVNDEATDTTTVTITNGTVNGSVYGGGLGQQGTGDANLPAWVYGEVKVNIKGGIINGNVFGCNNLNGSPKDDVIVTITDGTIENVFGGGNQAVTTVSPVVNIQGGNISKVFGGGNEAGVTATDVNIDGGTITSGIYGGCNTSGTVTGDITVDVTAGTIGNATNPVNIHGGGYGALTATTGNVNVTINGRDLDIYGDIYGGSALGSVNDNATDQTNVTLDNGNIHGSIYGGGLGQKTGVNGATSDIAANVNGAVQVTVNGGSVIGKTSAIYGCNNINGAPQSTVHVDIYNTDDTESGKYAIQAVYGGGNQADYAAGTPHVTVHNCDNSIKFVYGGGNAAHITHPTDGNTDVTIWGANSIDTLFGGGNGEITPANISGHSEVKIYGGTIHNVFGGSNTNGTMGDPAQVTIESQIEPDKTEACPMDVTSLVPGGNRAYGNGGVLNIGCGSVLQDVYGGANNADIGTPEIPKDIILNIRGGKIDRVFGGNNIGGTVYGKIVVNINIDEECGDEIGYVYGGGNQANYTAPTSTTFEGYPEYTGNYPEVNIIRGHILHDVYGGGLGDSSGTKGKVTGNPQVKIYSGTESDGSGGTTDKVKIDGNVFGGGNAGKVIGNTNVVVGVPEP